MAAEQSGLPLPVWSYVVAAAMIIYVVALLFLVVDDVAATSKILGVL